MPIKPACKTVARLASESMDRNLTLGEWLVMKTHLCFCVACRRFARHLRFLRRAARSYGGEWPGKAKLRGEARERIQHELGMRGEE